MESKKTQIVNMFIWSSFLLLGIAFIEWLVITIISQNPIAYPLFFAPKSDIFMDFFNINYYVADGQNPYLENESSYPPLILLIARFFALFADYSMGRQAARSSFTGTLSCIIFVVLTYSAITFCVYRLSKKVGFARKTSILLCVIFLLSAPSLYLLERTNYMLVALLFSLLYFLLYDSDSKILRECSILCLAAAFAIKFYPIAFGILLFKDKRYFAIVRLAIYSVILFFVPFVFFSGGFSNISAFLSNLSSFSSWTTVFDSYSVSQIIVSFANMFVPFEPNEAVINISKIISYIFGILAVLAAFLAPKKWQSLLAATLAMVYLVTPAFMYIGTFFIIPLLFFLADEDKKKSDYAIMVLFIILLQPTYIGYIADGGLHFLLPFDDKNIDMTISLLLQCLSLVALLGMMTWESIINVISFFKNRKAQAA